MKIAIRVDASSQIGSGHLMRCKTLADELRKRGAEILFICCERPGNLITLLRESGYATAVLPAPQSGDAINQGNDDSDAWPEMSQTIDATQTLEALGDAAPDWLIVDHYGLDIIWESLLRPRVGRIFVIDDLANRLHDCDILLDQNAHENPIGRYHGKIPPACTGLYGPRYALLREEFRTVKHQLKRRQQPIKRILVTFGGADCTNETMKVLNVLEASIFSAVGVDVVIGIGHPGKNEIAALCSRHACWHLHCGTKEMAGLMAGADIAVGAGGITTWERIYLGLPAFVKVTASNQAEALDYLARLGQVKIWRDTGDLAELLSAHLMSGVALPPFDIHFGTSVIAERILPRIKLVPFGANHVRRTYKWLADPQLREAFLLATAPTVKGHCQYWRSEFRCPTQTIFAIYSGEQHVGNCGLKHFVPEEGRMELWIYIGRAMGRGYGAGEAALKLLENEAIKKITHGRLYLHVGKSNSAAAALYRKAGFTLSGSSDAAIWGARAPEVLCMEKLW